MSDDATVLVELKDGRCVTGYPRNGPQYQGDGINELCLVYPEVLDDDGASHPVPGGPGIILPLSEISYVAMSEDPTGVPALDADHGSSLSDHSARIIAAPTPTDGGASAAS
jgi:hypothetical protein